MKLGVVKTIQKEELSKFGELPGWVDPLLTALNSFIEQTGKALQGNLTFADNFLTRGKQLRFQSGAEQVLNPEAGNLRVYGVIPLSSELKVEGFGWQHRGEGKIAVTFDFTGGGQSICEILILLR